MINNSKISKVLCIIGPTGTGKTKLAIKINQQIPSIIISADSRQIYRGMDIVTGKDHPSNAIIYGINLVDPDVDYSVSQWHDAILPIINDAESIGLLPIVVGGTGLYISSLIAKIDTLHIPINQELRTELEKLSVADLQSKLALQSHIRFANMNHSDQNNPRRLIRAIEVEVFRIKNINPEQIIKIDAQIIGLLPPIDLAKYRQAIYSRVVERINQGAINETKTLLARYSADLPSFSGIGYRPIIRFLDNKINQEQMMEEWTNSELSYAKRQLLFMRKIPGVEWYDKDIQENNLWKSKISI
ncbi:MAG: tRNA (adenosine(37)-N6)-dimethylallyltransferase MiaA [bacterium]